MNLELERSSVRTYLFELELGLRVKPKARARLGSFEVLRTISNELNARLELAQMSQSSSLPMLLLSPLLLL
ncbi:hypothetical protein Hanom_Chr04g00317591 [Helianthus anomalus]